MRAVLRDAWRLAGPYFTRSDERWSARILLAVIIAMNLASVGIDVVLNYWHGAFYDALQQKDFTGFLSLILTWRSWPGRLHARLPADRRRRGAPGHLQHLPAAAAHDPLAPMDDREHRCRLADRAGLLHHLLAVGRRPSRNRNPYRQPGPAYQRGPQQLHHRYAEPRARPVLQRRQPDQLRPDPLGLVGLNGDLRRHHPRLHALAGAGLRRRRHLAHPPRGPPARRARVPAPEGRGRFSLRPRPRARECRGGRALCRRGAGARRAAVTAWRRRP